MPRRKSRSDEAILDAVLTVMFAAGPGEFTFARAAEAAGVSPATLVQRFKTKQKLIAKAVARANEKSIAAMNAAPARRSEEAVIALFLALTPGREGEAGFADQLLWLREDFRDPAMNKLARALFAALREAVIARLPPSRLAPARAARLLDAQWQGALLQWGFEKKGALRAYVRASLRDWFAAIQG
jgi:AcrR family transcriptional regulator